MNNPTTGTGEAAPAPGSPGIAPYALLRCPECGEVAVAVAPVERPLAGWRPVPRFSHHDGTPLCPIVGPDGYTPAEPTGPAPARTTPTGTATTGPAEPRGSAITGGGESAGNVRCRAEGCPGDPADGDGYDGYCASCADGQEAAGAWG